MLTLRAIAVGMLLLIAVSCRNGRSSKIRSITCCAAYQHSDTLPAKPDVGVVRIAVGGDSRDDRSHVIPWAFKEAMDRDSKAFVFLGDMELTRAEDRFFLPRLKSLRGIPFFPVIGNHEVEMFGIVRLSNGQRAVRQFKKDFLSGPGFALAPVSEIAYSGEIGNRIHFIGLDNVSRRGEGFGDDQLRWLLNDLKTASAAHRVILVGMHKPLANNPITTHAMDEDGPAAVRSSDAALALFKQYKVALLFVSHSHMYASYKQEGIETRLTGGLGAPVVKGLAEDDGGFHHFLLVDVSSDTNAPLRVEVVKVPAPTTRDQRDEGSEADD